MTVLPVYMMTAIGAALLESRGMWRANTILHFVSAIGTVIAAWIGATAGGLWEIALAATIFRGGYGVLHGVCMAKVLDRRPRDFMWAVVPPCVTCSTIAWAVIVAMSRPLAQQGSLVQAAAMAGVYLLIIAAVYGMFSRPRVQELIQTFRTLRPRKPTVVGADADTHPSTLT